VALELWRRTAVTDIDKLSRTCESNHCREPAADMQIYHIY
jgi:hypothetical protein